MRQDEIAHMNTSDPLLALFETQEAHKEQSVIRLSVDKREALLRMKSDTSVLTRPIRIHPMTCQQRWRGVGLAGVGLAGPAARPPRARGPFPPAPPPETAFAEAIFFLARVAPQGSSAAGMRARTPKR